MTTTASSKEMNEELVMLKRYDLLLDTQSTIHIFKDSRLLKNIRKSNNAVTIAGIGGELLVDEIADAGVFGTVYYHPQAVANVISFAVLEDKHGNGCIEYVPETKSFEASLANGQKHFSFVRRDRLFICNMKSDKSAGLPTRKIGGPLKPEIIENTGVVGANDFGSINQDTNKVIIPLTNPNNKNHPDNNNNGVEELPIDGGGCCDD